MVTNSRATIHRRNFSLHLQERPDYECIVLIKESASELPTKSQVAQLHNEYVITRQLSDVPGVRPVYAKEGSESQPFLLLEYIQGQSLSELIQAASLDIPEKLRIAVEMAGILSCIQDRKSVV